MSCVLRIKGKEFDVEHFLRLSNLKPYDKHIKGEKKEFNKKENNLHKTSGCSFDLSEASFDRFDLQKKDVILFLTKHFDKLKDLYSFGLTKDESPIIDFAIVNRMDDVFIQCDYLEPELLKLVGELAFGIEISQYHPSSD